MKLYKKIKIMMLVALLGLTHLQASDSKNSVDAILATGAQMSNMRNMLETYALIATKVSYMDPNARLTKGIAEYEATLASIETNFKDKELQESVALSKKAWVPVKEALLTALKDSDAERMQKEGLFIHGNIRSVIKELANMKKFLLEKEKIQHGEQLNAAIEIAASSQRLSAHYMMKMWGLPDPTIQEHWDKGIEIYTNSIAVLKASEYYKDEAFKKLLDESEKHLKYFEMVIGFEDKYVPVLVHDKANVVYEDANEMSRMILLKSAK